MSLFGDIIEESAPEISFPDIPEWKSDELLSLEKNALGVYVSGHPFEPYAKYFKDCSFHCGMLADFEEDEETGDRVYHQITSGQQVTMGGLIAGIKKINTKAGALMAFVTVEDLYGNIDCLAFPRVYEKIKGNLRKDGVARITGKIDISPEKLPVIVLDNLEAFEEPEQQQEKNIPEEQKENNQVLWLDARGLSEEDFSELLEMMEGYPGEQKTKILHGGKRYEYSVHLSRAFQAELRTYLDKSCMKLI